MDKKFYIKFFDPKLNQVIQKPLEEMVRLLLPSQIDIKFHIEALKAQAVIIRTNLLRKSRRLGGKGCNKYKKVDLCKSNHCCDFYYIDELKRIWGDDFKKNIQKINKAVDETKDIVITMNNSFIVAKYHDTCGGSTENSENVLNNTIIYLRRVLCDYCKNSPYSNDTKDFSLKDIEDALKIKFSNNICFDTKIDGFIEDIQRDEQGRVKSLKIGGKTFKGQEIMELLKLNSTKFDISPLTVRFTTKGKGHGLGFCQYGGNEMGKRGFNFKEILNYYYTGVEVKKYPVDSIKKPLYGKILVLDPGHGGNNVGYISNSGIKEKDIVLNICKKFKDRLQSLGALVYLTRDKDKNMLIVKRAELVNNIKPNFFISFHMDYFPNSNKKGCKAYYFKKDVESRKLGQLILDRLEKEMNIANKGINEGEFFLLKGVGVNSLLMEIGYLSNKEEEKNFLNQDYIQKLIDSISKSILEYYEY